MEQRLSERAFQVGVHADQNVFQRRHFPRKIDDLIGTGQTGLTNLIAHLAEVKGLKGSAVITEFGALIAELGGVGDGRVALAEEGSPRS